MTHAAKTTSSHIDVLDGLRGIAILIVVWFHLWQISWWGTDFSILGHSFTFDFIATSGFIGVSLFFFISGFCLALPYVRAAQTGTKPPRVLEFYGRRVLKIFPSYWLNVLVILFMGWGAVAYQSPVAIGKLALLHLTFVQNLNPFWSGSINGVLWSLAVEIQFYLLFPLLVRIFLKWPESCATVVLAASSTYRLWASAQHFDGMIFYSNQLPGVLDLFFFGMLGAHWTVKLGQKRWSSTFQTASTMIGIFSLLIFLAILLIGHIVRYDPFWYTAWEAHLRPLLDVVFFALALGSVLGKKAWRKILANRLFVLSSAVSYNWYLWHQCVGDLIRHSGWIHSSTPDPHNDPAWQLHYFWIALPTTFLVAWLITRFFEQPILNWGHRILKKKLKAR